MNCPHCQKPAPNTNYKCPHCGGILRNGISPLDFQQKIKPQNSKTLTVIIAFIMVVGLGVLAYLMIQKGKQKKSQNSRNPSPYQQNIQTKSVEPANTQGTIKQDDLLSSGESEAGDDLSQSGVGDMDRDSLSNQSGDDIFNETKKTDTSSYDLPQMDIEDYKPGENVDITKLIYPGKINIFDFYSEFCGPCRIVSPKLERLDNQREDIIVIKININRKNVHGIDWNSPVSRQYNLRSIPHFIVYDDTGLLIHEGAAARPYVFKLLYEAGIY